MGAGEIQLPSAGERCVVQFDMCHFYRCVYCFAGIGLHPETPPKKAGHGFGFGRELSVAWQVTRLKVLHIFFYLNNPVSRFTQTLCVLNRPKGQVGRCAVDKLT